MPALEGSKPWMWEASTALGKLKQMGEREWGRRKLWLGNDLKPPGKESSELPICYVASAQREWAPGINIPGTAPTCWLGLAALTAALGAKAEPDAKLQGTRGIPTPSHTTRLTAGQPPPANPSMAAEV